VFYITNPNRSDGTEDEVIGSECDIYTQNTGYEEEFSVVTGADLSSSLALLITQVDTDDATRTYTPYISDSDKENIRDGFNLLVQELNVSEGVFYANYTEYEDLIVYEAIVSSVAEFSSNLTILIETPFVVGDCITFQAIDCFVEYAPENLGDSSLGKQFREATLMFDQYNFTFGEMGFRSDLVAAMSTQLFQGEGTGDYGAQVYGEQTYGGNANERPFRTYVPRNQQRCRHIIISFGHQAARESFMLNGYSVTYNDSTNSRSYKR